MHIHICAHPAASVFADVYVSVSVTYTPVHALVPTTPVKCTHHSLQRNCTHIHTHTHMHMHTHPQEYPCASLTSSKHAEKRLLRLTTCAQICIHIHIQMHIHAYVHIYIYTCIYIHTCTSVHIHTYTYIHTHVQHINVHKRKHVRTTAPYPDIAPPKLHPIICTGAKLIHQIHGLWP